MVPMALGKQPFPVFNDFALTLLVSAWWLVHYVPGDLFYKLYKNSTLVRCTFAAGYEVSQTLKQGSHFAVPLQLAHIACGA